MLTCKPKGAGRLGVFLYIQFILPDFKCEQIIKHLSPPISLILTGSMDIVEKESEVKFAPNNHSTLFLVCHLNSKRGIRLMLFTVINYLLGPRVTHFATSKTSDQIRSKHVSSQHNLSVGLSVVT